MCLLLAVVFSFVQPSLAGIRPAFLLDYCSWHATDNRARGGDAKTGCLSRDGTVEGGVEGRTSCHRLGTATTHGRDADCCLPKRVR